jgi:beta-1,4-N-acetylglucosaminyltransferase
VGVFGKEVQKGTLRGKGVLIFVTVGTPAQGFPRLIRKMDEIAGRTDEPVIMQIGHERYKPRNAQYFNFVNDFEEIRQLNRQARVVVCHGGIGSITTALEQGTPVIAVPRRKKYREENDDVQVETVDVFEREGLIRVVCEVDDLENALNQSVPRFKPVSQTRQLIDCLKAYMSSLAKSGA